MDALLDPVLRAADKRSNSVAFAQDNVQPLCQTYSGAHSRTHSLSAPHAAAAGPGAGAGAGVGVEVKVEASNANGANHVPTVAQYDIGFDHPAGGGPSPGTVSTSISYGGPGTPVTPSNLVHPDDGHHHALLFNHDGTPFDANDLKRPRACEACRGLKVKCEYDPANFDGPCKRCAKANRSCVVSQPTRKRQKKTDSRVAELEKKIDALTASLQATRSVPGGSQQGPAAVAAQPNVPSSAYGMPPHVRTPTPRGALPARESHSPPLQTPKSDGQPSFVPPSHTIGLKRKLDETSSQVRFSPTQTPTPATAHPIEVEEHGPDVIDRGIMTMDQANNLFARYHDKMVMHLPAVVFPPGTSGAEVRRSKPLLFLAIIAAASAEEPAIQRQLMRELVRSFADRIVILGEKSLEMVQALQVCTIWYFPAEQSEDLKFYQFVHIAAVMAIDIGLGRRKNQSKTRLIPYTWRDHPFRKVPLPDPTSIESRRAWLASYFLASSVAMSLHRPNLIRWTSFTTECIDVLESSVEALPSDRLLCHLVWTHRLAEEVGLQLSLDDSAVFVNVREPKVQYALKAFENDMSKYSERIPQHERHASLILSFHVLSLYMHEVALRVDTMEDIKPVFNADSLREPVPGLTDTLTPAHVGALSSCLTAIDGIFNTFLSMDVDSIRCLPVFNLVRVAYAVIVLTKMYFSASTPNSELGKVINKDNMKVEEYLNKLIERFRGAAEGGKSLPAGKFVVVLVMLRSWFQKQGNVTGNVKTDDATPAPLLHQQQSEYKPEANTGLQLLSAIATGNGSRGSQNGAVAEAPIPHKAPAPPPWTAQSFAYGASGAMAANGAPDGTAAGLPNDVAFIGNSSDGVGFTSAMNSYDQSIDLSWAGSSHSPGDMQNLRFLVGDDMLGPMIDSMGGGFFQF